MIGGMGLLGFWVYRTFLSGAVYYGYLALTLVIAAVGVALALKLKQKDGVWTIRGKGDCGSPAWRGLSAVLFDGGGDSHSPFAPLALGAAVAYYAMWIMAAWLFILAVYFTSKLM